MKNRTVKTIVFFHPDAGAQKPIIKKMMGLDKQLPVKISAILADSFNKNSPQRRFLRAELQRKNRINYVKPAGKQGNGILKSMVNCNVMC